MHPRGIDGCGLTAALDVFATELRAAGDDTAAEQMAAYMKDRFPFAGVKSRERKRLQKPIMAVARTADANQLLEVAEACWKLDEREFQYTGQEILRAGAERLRAADLDRVRTLIETKSWWDTVDSLAAHTVGPIVARHDLGPTMDVWIDDPNIWVARTAILHQLGYKDRVDEQRLFAYATKRAGDTEFFIRKALGWALRNYARVEPDAVRNFVAEHDAELSGLTKREATRHL